MRLNLIEIENANFAYRSNLIYETGIIFKGANNKIDNGKG